MERPIHQIAGAIDAGKRRPGSRLISAAIAAAIQFAVVFGLITALSQGRLLKQLREIQADIDTQKEIPKAPPPPPPQFVKPKPPVAIVPEFTVQSPAPSPIVTVPKRSNAPAAAPAPIHVLQDQPLRAVPGTHILPPYPPIARRLSEQGTSIIVVTITTRGTVSDCTIAQSSSSDRLDSAACDFVTQHWRWMPPTRAGKPISVKTRISIKWDLVTSVD